MIYNYSLFGPLAKKGIMPPIINQNNVTIINEIAKLFIIILLFYNTNSIFLYLNLNRTNNNK